MLHGAETHPLLSTSHPLHGAPPVAHIARLSSKLGVPTEKQALGDTSLAMQAEAGKANGIDSSGMIRGSQWQLTNQATQTSYCNHFPLRYSFV